MLENILFGWLGQNFHALSCNYVKDLNWAMFSIVGTKFSSVPLLRGCETAMKFVLVQLRPRVGQGWRGGGRHQTNLSLAIYLTIYKYILYNDI